jgi:hypothetical protein
VAVAACQLGCHSILYAKYIRNTCVIPGCSH